ncbi:MAG: halocyanin domain-containing protein [Haloferacaceae archaeon]
MGADQYTRRRALRTGTIAIGGGMAAIAGCAGGESQSAEGSEARFDGYLSNVSNYDGSVTDRTGRSEVTVEVGAEGNGGAFAFAPAAVRISTGTTVVWEWTGKGGSHNVVHEGDAFASKLVESAGHTFAHTFESTGEYKYVCTPHRSLGMKGVVVVA